MLWAALLPDLPSPDPSRHTEALAGLSTWCLQYTPRVAVIEPLSASAAVVMEVEASVRLFGGKRRLVERVRQESIDLGVQQLSWAPTSLAAVALARAGLSNGMSKPLSRLLDELPIVTLTAVANHLETLARLGCQTLGQVRALPRGGLSRRFDADLLGALDQAYGLRPEVHAWASLPDHFCAKLELMARVETAPALLFGARRLMLQMAGWLAARHSGVTAFTLRWCHDAMRSRSAGDGGELTVRTAQATRDIEHLTRLLAEHLAKLVLLAPVGDLELIAAEVHALDERSLSLIPEPVQAGESLALVLERIAARLAPGSVLRPVVQEDHRLEWMRLWQPAPTPRPKRQNRSVEIPQPTFVLPEPIRLAMRGERPLYQGVLQLLAGPHRVEGGWWDRTSEDGAATTRNVARDYWVALSEFAGVLWIFSGAAGGRPDGLVPARQLRLIEVRGDPARMSVLFERFISKERNEPPDIDIDFEHQRREEVLQYLYAKYGRDRAAITGVVQSYRPKSAIRDVGKALGSSLETVDAIAKGHHWWDGKEVMKERLVEVGLSTDDLQVQQLLHLTAQLLNFPRHLSQHTGGFVLTKLPLSRMVPIENASMEGRTVLQWDKDDLDAVGLLKVDCLALGMLSALRRALEFVGARKGYRFEMQDIPAEDQVTYDMICKADTVGVFQIESRAQMSMLPRLQPRCFYDLVIEVAIVRPGPIVGGMVHP